MNGKVCTNWWMRRRFLRNIILPLFVKMWIYRIYYAKNNKMEMCKNRKTTKLK